MNRKKFYKDKVVIITGASSGIGKATALILARSGAKVVLAARNKKKLEDLQKQIHDEGFNAYAIITDVSKQNEIKNLVDKTINKFGRIDILISNAGLYVQSNIVDADVDTFAKSFAVNFYGSFYAVNNILNIMIAQKSGHIVFVNSLDAMKGIVGDAPYVAAKSALHGFGDVLRQEMKSKGVKISSIYPARVDTPMIQDLKVPVISRKISSESVANAIINGIRKNKPVVVVPKLFYNLGALNNTVPRLMDWLYKIFRLEGEYK